LRIAAQVNHRGNCGSVAVRVIVPLSGRAFPAAVRSASAFLAVARIVIDSSMCGTAMHVSQRWIDGVGVYSRRGGWRSVGRRREMVMWTAADAPSVTAVTGETALERLVDSSRDRMTASRSGDTLAARHPPNGDAVHDCRSHRIRQDCASDEAARRMDAAIRPKSRENRPPALFFHARESWLPTPRNRSTRNQGPFRKALTSSARTWCRFVSRPGGPRRVPLTRWWQTEARRTCRIR
jgi:hypothetical protein